MDERGELLAGDGWRQRQDEEGGEADVVLVELGGGVAGRHGSAKGRVRIEERVSSGGARGGGGDVRDREKREGIERWEGRRDRRRCGKGSRERWDRGNRGEGCSAREMWIVVTTLEEGSNRGRGEVTVGERVRFRCGL